MRADEWAELGDELTAFYKEQVVPEVGKKAAREAFKVDRQALFVECSQDYTKYEYWMWFFTEHLNRHRHPPGQRVNPLAKSELSVQPTVKLLKLDFS